MTASEKQTQLETIDRQIADLCRQRISLNADRAYERHFIGSLNETGDIAMATMQKTLFRTLFGLSHSYTSSRAVTNSTLDKTISDALESTAKIFPDTAVVACQGIEGAYSQIATDKLFANADIMYFRTFDGVFQAVEAGLCKYGVLPIENSSYGSVTQVYDLMKSHKFHIVRAMKLQISHRLLAKPGVKFEDIREVYSHNQAIGQCSRFLRDNKNIKVNIVANTAVAAQMVKDSDRNDIAAISSPDCALLYGLDVIRSDIQNSDHNYTRFIVICKDLEIYPGADKASIMLALGHTPGSLSDMLARFSAQGLNLTKLESRPIEGRDFEFMFYLDVEASVYSEAFINLMSQLDSDPAAFTFLGSYKEN
jgi:chorismate mutase/prephenate dehydratase